MPMLNDNPASRTPPRLLPAVPAIVLYESRLPPCMPQPSPVAAPATHRLKGTRESVLGKAFLGIVLRRDYWTRARWHLIGGLLGKRRGEEEE